MNFMPPPPKPNKGPERPHTLREFPSYLKKLIGGFFSRLFYIIGLVWEANPAILIAMVVLCLLSGVLPVVGAYVSKFILDEIVLAMQIDIGSVGQFLSSSIVFLLIVYFIHQLLSRVVSRISSMVNQIAGEVVVNHIKLKIMNKAATVDSASFDRPEFYEKMENANREAGMRPIMILNATFNVISTVISMVSFIVILWGLHPLAPLLIAIMALPTAIVNYVYRHKTFRYIRRHSKERREMEYFSSSLVNKDNIKEMRVMDLSDTFIKKYESAFKRYFKGIKKLIYAEGVASILSSLLTLAASCALFAYVAWRVVMDGNMQIGDYSLYTGALNSITGCVSTLIVSTASIYEGTLFIDNMLVFMREEPKIVPVTEEPLVPEIGGKHTVEFRNVSFSYPGTQREVLKNVSFTVKSGESVVLVGINGAGKSTLIKLLTRLYDPTSGAIYLDGRDIREYDVKKYYELFGIIFQDFGKYAVSVKENIAFGDIHRGVDDIGIETAAKESDAHSFIDKLELGYDTPLMRIFEEKGTELSIGQWQKLSIARAFYKKSDILILDEPTASLDAIAEAEVFNQFSELCRDKISIFVSHRLSSATLADTIIVLDNNTVAEIGDHKRLMEEKGKYYRLFSTQAKHYIEN